MVQMYFQTVLQALCLVRFRFKPHNHNTLEKHLKVHKFKVIHVISIKTIVQDNKSVSELTFISEVLVYLF